MKLSGICYHTIDLKLVKTICASFDNFSCASSWFNQHEYIMVPSAKLETFASLMKNITSFIQRLNKIGPNIDPFETPSKDVQDMN